MARQSVSQALADRIKMLRGFGLTQEEVAIRTGRAKKTIERCEKRGYTATDWGSGRRKKRPDDFAIVIPNMPFWDAARHYGVDFPVVKRWASEIGFTRTNGEMNRGRPSPKRRPLPEDFAAFYRAHGFNATRRHFAAANTVVRRWLDETGTPRNNRRRAKPQPAPVSIVPPPGYEAMKRKLPEPRFIYGQAA